ncbi:MAG: hypothetical protein IPJ36_08355 [Simplicispira sp.]|nr:hypothetical protein [Simplicispira sp.]
MSAPHTDESLPDDSGMALPPAAATGPLSAAEPTPRMTLAAPVVLPPRRAGAAGFCAT